MKRKLLLNILVLSMLAFLVACGKSGGQSEAPANSTSSESTETTEPVKIRFGGGYATEEPLWLLEIADESIVPNKGKSYTIEVSQFRANADRLNAFQAGQIDAGSLGQGASILAYEQGIPIKVVSVMAKDTPGEGFNNTFMTLKDSEINSIEDLKGKTIGLSDFKAPADLWVRSALRSAGLDPDKDVNYAITPIPAMGEAVRAKRIDVGMFPQPFYAEAEASGEFKEIFNSKTGLPVDEDFLAVFFDPKFISENEQAVRDFLADLKNAIEYYMENGEEVRQMIIDAGKVQTDPEIYVNMFDSNRSAYLDIEGWEKIQDIMVADGWLKGPIDLNDLVDNSYLPAQ